LDIQTWVAWANVIVSGAVTIILVPLAIYFVRYYWDRRRWHTYEGLIQAWAREEFFPDDMTDDDWSALAATKLSEAGFEPARVIDLMQLAVWFAKARASQELRGRIPSSKGPEGYGKPQSPR
jgi:hypothetical protein